MERGTRITLPEHSEFAMSRMMYRTVGNTVIEWIEDSPLQWTMRDSVREGTPPIDSINCDFSTLTLGYDEGFLHAMKDIMISLRHRVQLPTIQVYSKHIRLVLTQVHAKNSDGIARFTRIDRKLLAILHAIKNDIPATYLNTLKWLHRTNRDNEDVFEIGLQPGDFPTARSKRGAAGDRIHRIMGKALSRSTLVHILDVVETAFEEKRVDLGRYAFIRLALNVFCRNTSYRQITLADLRIDTDPSTGAQNYFLAVLPAKSRVKNPRKIIYKLHPEVGKLLAMQRQAIVEKCKNLAILRAGVCDVEQLALFPAVTMTDDGSSWVSKYANLHGGMLSSNSFDSIYVIPIKHLTCTPLSLSGLRHTIGTQLAQIGCSAKTIQAVLKHASDLVCYSYVDMAFHGLIDKLSDSLQTSFDRNFPVFNTFTTTGDITSEERRIDSTDLETNRVETTGMCGRTVACEYAPIACYACPRFIPCFDADHSINMQIVEREIEASRGMGLAMQYDVQRWKTIRNHIRLTIIACDHRRTANELEAASVDGEPT